MGLLSTGSIGDWGSPFYRWGVRRGKDSRVQSSSQLPHDRPSFGAILPTTLYPSDGDGWLVSSHSLSFLSLDSESAICFGNGQHLVVFKNVLVTFFSLMPDYPKPVVFWEESWVNEYHISPRCWLEPFWPFQLSGPEWNEPLCVEGITWGVFIFEGCMWLVCLLWPPDTLICDHTPAMHGNISLYFRNNLLVMIYMWVTVIINKNNVFLRDGSSSSWGNYLSV